MVSTRASYAAAAQSLHEQGKAPTSALSFKLEGSHFPSYSSFRDSFASHLQNARQRICVLTKNFEDRELAYVLFSASRRSLALHLRVEPKTPAAGNVGRLGRLLDDFRGLGLSVQEKTLKPLKLPEPTVVAIDNRAWSVSSELSEISLRPVDVESAPFTAAEVCGWAEDASGAKAATQR